MSVCIISTEVEHTEPDMITHAHSLLFTLTHCRLAHYYTHYSTRTRLLLSPLSVRTDRFEKKGNKKEKTKKLWR